LRDFPWGLACIACARRDTKPLFLRGKPSPSQCQAVPARRVQRKRGMTGFLDDGVGGTAGGLHRRTAHSVASDTGPIPGTWFALLNTPSSPPPCPVPRTMGVGGTPERAPLDRERCQGSPGAALCQDAVGAEEQFSIIESPKLFADKRHSTARSGSSREQQGTGAISGAPRVWDQRQHQPEEAEREDLSARFAHPSEAKPEASKLTRGSLEGRGQRSVPSPFWGG